MCLLALIVDGIDGKIGFRGFHCFCLLHAFAAAIKATNSHARPIVSCLTARTPIQYNALGEKRCGEGNIDIRIASLLCVPFSVCDEDGLMLSLSIAASRGWTHPHRRNLSTGISIIQ